MKIEATMEMENSITINTLLHVFYKVKYKGNVLQREIQREMILQSKIQRKSVKVNYKGECSTT